MDGGMLTDEVVVACYYWAFMINKIRLEWGDRGKPPTETINPNISFFFSKCLANITT